MKEEIRHNIIAGLCIFGLVCVLALFMWIEIEEWMTEDPCGAYPDNDPGLFRCEEINSSYYEETQTQRRSK